MLTKQVATFISILPGHGESDNLTKQEATLHVISISPGYGEGDNTNQTGSNTN